MKKLFILFCVVIICFNFTACNRGVADNVSINLGATDKFSEDEFEAAANCVINKFKQTFGGCELTDLWYDKEMQEAEAMGYKDEDESNNIMVLMSNFDVDSSGGDGSFEPNSTISGWKWLLSRDSEEGKWKVYDWGY